MTTAGERDVVLAHFELEPTGSFWSVRGKLWGEGIQVVLQDQPGRDVALAVALVEMARLAVRQGRGRAPALAVFYDALEVACNDLEAALYPDPPLAEKIATAKARHESSLVAEGPSEPEPSCHGGGGVD